MPRRVKYVVLDGKSEQEHYDEAFKHKLIFPFLSCFKYVGCSRTFVIDGVKMFMEFDLHFYRRQMTWNIGYTKRKMLNSE